MQSYKFKLFTFFFIFIVVANYTATAQDNSTSIKQADSLFVAKKYTESLAIYERLFNEEKLQSPAMLLKMAYISEGMDEAADALFYLEHYQKVSRDQAALLKISELAQEFNLRGYETSDTNLFIDFYGRYHIEIAAVLLSFAILLFSIFFYRQRKFNEKPAPLFAGIVVFLLLSVIVFNKLGIAKQAIVQTDYAMAMKGPSAGSDMIEGIGKGHKVSVLGKKDVWVRIRWKDQEVFVRENSLRII
jgi:hypothetical protein